jgi:hypothetical protein
MVLDASIDRGQGEDDGHLHAEQQKVVVACQQS